MEPAYEETNTLSWSEKASIPDFRKLRETMQATQRLWEAVPLKSRLRVIRRFRRSLWRDIATITFLMPDQRPLDIVSAEILPLHAAASFLLRRAPSLLSDESLSFFGQPIWLLGLSSLIRRRALGTVLILAPGNYPLMLAGIQVLQAIVAGNTVVLKPAPGRTAITARFLFMLERAGLPRGVVHLLPEECGPQASEAGFDLIILTGSAQTGQAVAQAAARTLTPAIMELSGADPVFVLPSASIDLVARALHFGLTLKSGETCIAPRRVYIHEARRAALEEALAALFAQGRHTPKAPPSEALGALSTTILENGGQMRHMGDATVFVLDASQACLVDIDCFAPWVALISVASMAEAAEIDRHARHALGASVFGAEKEAKALAAELSANTICINDLIVPSADPRLPFGGRRTSGYGMTRGREGLLAMTRPVGISVRKRMAWHLLPVIRRFHAR